MKPSDKIYDIFAQAMAYQRSDIDKDEILCKSIIQYLDDQYEAEQEEEMTPEEVEAAIDKLSGIPEYMKGPNPSNTTEEI